MFAIQFEYNLALAILFGIVSTVCLNLGKGVQRLGAETLGKDMRKKWKEKPEERRKIILWIAGSLMTAVAAVAQVAAQMFLDRSSTFVALGGIGILSVVIFSVYVIKEKVSRLQIIGIATIIAGTVLLGFDYTEATMSLPGLNFVWYACTVACIGVTMAIVSVKLNKRHGIVFGIIAGVCNGFASIATSFSVATGGRELTGSIINPWLVASIVVGQGAFWTTQYAFKKGGNASLVVPAQAAFLILVPFINDAFIYMIPLGIFQVLAFALNIGGIILLCTASSKSLNRLLSSPVEKAKEEAVSETSAGSK
nr:hypothetical protein [Candidatus Sigynarchaeota archaeon]